MLVFLIPHRFALLYSKTIFFDYYYILRYLENSLQTQREKAEADIKGKRRQEERRGGRGKRREEEVEARGEKRREEKRRDERASEDQEA
eukprot:752800-Hanusia_phi.AAC.4